MTRNCGMMLITPSNGLWAPKTILNEAALRTNCRKNKVNANRRVLESSGSRNIRHTANPDSTYSVVQTGPKIQLGGLNVGLLSPAYQGARFGYVAIWPRTDAATTAVIASAPNPK